MRRVATRDPHGAYYDYVNEGEANVGGFHWLTVLAVNMQQFCDAYYSVHTRRSPCYVVAGWRRRPHAHVRLHFFGVDPPMRLQWQIFDAALKIHRVAGIQVVDYGAWVGTARVRWVAVTDPDDHTLTNMTDVCATHEDCMDDDGLARACWLASRT